MLNWARIERGASHGGGVNGYAQALALELAAVGHEVHWICGGATRDPDVPMPKPPTGSCHIRRHPDWREIHVHEIMNSPVRAPSLAQAQEPLGEVACPVLESVIRDFWKALRPDVLHIHNIEGFSLGCVEAARALGARTCWSLHNYHTICPQVYLMQGHRTPCMDYRNGQACIACLSPQPPLVTPTIQRTTNPLWPGSPLRPGPWWGEFPDEWTPLENVPPVAPPSNEPASDYATRRIAMIRALNKCDRVLAVSQFVRDRFVTLGVRQEAIQILHIGTRFADQPGIASARPRASSHAAMEPVRLMFMGYHNHFKGLHVLLDALELLTPAVLARLHLSVRALNAEQIERPARRLESRLAGLSFGVGYGAEELPRLLAEEHPDLGVVPSIWWDNGPQTVMEFLACGVPVLGARVGGIPDFVRHGENGLLFRGNDRYDLARTLVRLTREPGLVDCLRRGVNRPKGMIEHAKEMDELYRTLAGGH